MLLVLPVLLPIGLLGGCQSRGTFEPRPDQDVVERLVWRGLYGQQGPAPPTEWREPECGTDGVLWGVWSYGVRSGRSAHDAGVTCRRGFYWLGGGIVVSQAASDPVTDWRSVVHEWLHSVVWQKTNGDADLSHNRTDWRMEEMAANLIGLVSPKPLRVVTYNIHHGTNYVEADTLAKIGDTLSALQADVILLQEVDRGVARSGGVDQMEILRAAVNMPYSHFQRTLELEGGEYGIAVLARRPFVASSALLQEQVHDGDWYEPRGYIMADFGGIAVVNTHLHPVPGYALQEAQALLGVLGAGAVVLGGDLNAVVGSPTMNLLTQNGFIAAESAPDDIDHFLVRGGLVTESVETVVVDHSDHRPRVGAFH